MNYNRTLHYQTSRPGLVEGIWIKFCFSLARSLKSTDSRYLNKAKHLNILLLPVLLLMMSGGTCMYLYEKFKAVIPVDQAIYARLQNTMQSVHVDTIAKESVLAIAKEAVEKDQRIAKILFHIGLLFIYIGLVNLAAVWKFPDRDKSHSSLPHS